MAPSSSTPPLSLLVVVVVVCAVLIRPGHAQSAAPPPPSELTNTNFNPSMAIIIVILVTAFFFLGFFSIYLRQCGNRDEPTVRPRAGAVARSRRGARGLEPSAIERFPTLVYSDVKEHKIGKGALECAVCLSEFEDDETLRLLPRCDHVFHTECIDTWLSSHTTCPVCRDNLAVEIPPVTPSSVPPADEVAIEIPPPPAAAPSPTAAAEEGGFSGELRRMGSRSVGRRLMLKWRSRSARPAAMQYWEEDERERFTLRLPESVRREILAGRLNRSASVSVAAVGLRSSRRGYRGEGSGRGGGRSFKMSDRWAAFLSRPLSFKLGRGGGGDGEGSSVRKGSAEGADAENSTRGKVFARRPLDCIGGGSGGVKDDSGDGEGSTVPFSKPSDS